MDAAISRFLVPALRPGGSHSSGLAITDRLKQPTRECKRRGPRHPPLFGFAPRGVFPAIAVTRNAVRSYRTISPLPASLAAHRRYIFCGTDPWKRALSPPPRPLAGTPPYGVRTLPRDTTFASEETLRAPRLPAGAHLTLYCPTETQIVTWKVPLGRQIQRRTQAPSGSRASDCPTSPALLLSD